MRKHDQTDNSYRFIGQDTSNALTFNRVTITFALAAFLSRVYLNQEFTSADPTSSIRRSMFSVTSTVPQSTVLSLFLSFPPLLLFYLCNSSPRSVQHVLTRPPRSLSIGGFREAIVHTFESEFNLREERVRRDTPCQLFLMKFDLFLDSIYS